MLYVKYFSIKPDKLLFTHFFIFKLCTIIHSISTFFRPKQHILHIFRYIPVFLIIFVFKFPTFIHHLSITGFHLAWIFSHFNIFTFQTMWIPVQQLQFITPSAVRIPAHSAQFYGIFCVFRSFFEKITLTKTLFVL